MESMYAPAPVPVITWEMIPCSVPPPTKQTPDAHRYKSVQQGAVIEATVKPSIFECVLQGEKNTKTRPINLFLKIRTSVDKRVISVIPFSRKACLHTMVAIPNSSFDRQGRLGSERIGRYHSRGGGSHRPTLRHNLSPYRRLGEPLASSPLHSSAGHNYRS